MPTFYVNILFNNNYLMLIDFYNILNTNSDLFCSNNDIHM